MKRNLTRTLGLLLMLTAVCVAIIAMSTTVKAANEKFIFVNKLFLFFMKVF